MVRPRVETKIKAADILLRRKSFSITESNKIGLTEDCPSQIENVRKTLLSVYLEIVMQT